MEKREKNSKRMSKYLMIIYRPNVIQFESKIRI